MFSIVKDLFNVLKKNILIDFKSPLSLLGEFILPALVSFIIYLSHSSSTVLASVFKELLPFYLGNLTTSLIRKFSILFIREREEKFGKYQRIMGLSITGYVFGNLTYCYILTLLVILFPLLLMLYYNPSIYIVAAFGFFVLSSTSFFLMLVSFFKDPKLCSEVVTLVCGLSALLYYVIDQQHPGLIGYFAMLFPPPNFAFQTINHSKKALSVMLLTAKFYFVIFAYRQFQINPLERCKQCVAWCKKRFGQPEQQVIEDEDVEEAIVFQRSSEIKTPLLKIRNVTKQYSQHIVIDNLSLTINQGEILTLLGRNGAGKTTLMNMISKIETPNDGTIEMLFEDLKIGICFQEETLYEELTIIQMLEFHLNIRRADLDDLNRILEKVLINQSYIKPIYALSGGTKRKLSIAISLLGDPSLLLYDEPTSGLDPKSRREIWSILVGLREQGKTIVLTTHNLDEADTISNRVCILQKGKMLVIGSPIFIKKRFGAEGYKISVTTHLFETRFMETVMQKYQHDITMDSCSTNHSNQIVTYNIKCQNQELFVPFLQELEENHNLTISIGLTSLQDSFISIISPSREESLSLTEQQWAPSREMEPPQHLKSSFLKIFYLIKRRPFKYFLLYNLNLVFLLFSMAVVKTLAHCHSSLIETVINQNITQFITLILLFQGYVFSLGVYIYTPVYERENKIVYLLRVRGMDWISYWAPYFTVDFTIFVLNSVAVYLLMGRTVSLFYLICFGASLIVFCYCCSYLFTSSASATRYFPVINFVLSLLASLTFLINNPTTKFIIHNLFVLVYPFSSFQDYLSVSVLHNHSAVDFMVLYPLLFQFSLYSAIIMCIELKVCSRVKSVFWRQSGIVESEEPIKFLDVSKKYSLLGQLALDSVSFEVDARESLGIIGPNGAGKSTIYKLLTSQEYKSSGTIYLQNKIHYSHNTTFDNSSICYQQDTLWNTLTPRQIMNIFGYMSGCISQEWHGELNLGEEAMSREFGKLSGGNKRKVCLEVCLLGNPKFVLLDECSTGLDPLTRRITLKKQNILRDAEGCLVFTSHSFMDIERLCQKVLILDKGIIKQYSSLYQLKKKYSSHLLVDIIHLNLPDNTQVIERMEELGEQTVLKKGRETLRSSWMVPKTHKLSSLFLKLEDLKNQRVIKEFVICQQSLEDIYLRLHS